MNRQEQLQKRSEKREFRILLKAKQPEKIDNDNWGCKPVYLINKVRLVMKKNSGRRSTNRVIACMWCSKIIECECKKVRVEGVQWKQWVPARQYCDVSSCAKKAINFKSKLTKKLLHPKDENEKLQAEYCLAKWIIRTPLKELQKVLMDGFIHDRCVIASYHARNKEKHHALNSKTRRKR